MQGIRNDDMHVVNAMTGEHVKDYLEHGLPDVRRSHRWQRQADVIDRDCDFHPGLELREKRIATQRVV